MDSMSRVWVGTALMSAIAVQEQDVPVLFLVFVVIPTVGYLFLIGKWRTGSKMQGATEYAHREAEENLRAEISEYLTAPTSVLNVLAVRREAQLASRAETAEYWRPPTSLNFSAVRPDKEDISIAETTEYLRPATSSTNACSVQRDTVDISRAETTEYFRPPISLMNFSSVGPDLQDISRAETTEHLRPPNPSINVSCFSQDSKDALRVETTEYLEPSSSLLNVCAVCNRHTSFRCKACKSIRYCSFMCQITHWRQGHKDECKKWHDSGVSHRYGGPTTTEDFDYMPSFRNLKSPIDDGGIHLNDINSYTLPELQFPTTDNYKVDTDPVPIQRSNMNKSSESLHKSEHDAVIGVTCEKSTYNIHEVNRPEILLVNKVSGSRSGNCDVTCRVNTKRPSICAPDIRKRHSPSTMFCKSDMGVNLTPGRISSCEGTSGSSTDEPLLRNFSCGISMELEAMEKLLIDGSAKPMMLSYAALMNITKNFSKVIGGGGSGQVYMGVLGNGKVAVKKLYNTETFTEKQFEDELTCLIRVEHKNIVRLLGYCSDTQQKLVEYNGRHVLADIRRRFLCFEYAPNKSLDDYLKDESHGSGLDTRYQLIKGICQGLHYLHKKRIIHLDLKPANSLLHANMVPKITDFGLSRRFSGVESRIITKNIRGSLGYIAPELLERGEISLKSDIFSLGIIIRNILRGSNDLSSQNWHQSLDIDCPRFKRCIKIVQLCVDSDPHKRPSMDYIMDMLNTA